MNKLLIIFLLLSSVACSFAADYEKPGNGAQEGGDVGFNNLTATSIQVGAGTLADPSILLGTDNTSGFGKDTGRRRKAQTQKA